MNGQSHTRWWRGVHDPVHPLSRAAHACVAYGRYIYVLNGYASTGDEMCLFDRVGIARFDPLTSSVHFLPIHWDWSSMSEHGCSLQLLCASGAAVALQPATLDTPACIYTFAGFSLSESFHMNTLVRFQLPHSHSPNPVEDSALVQLQPTCCRGKLVSGHGLLGCLLSMAPRSRVMETLVYTALRALRRRLTARDHRCCLRSTVPPEAPQPAPRDKLCMEYWRGRLYAFGGYGPNFAPPPFWPAHVVQWPFLYDASNPNEWYMCEQDRGWNNQLLVYDVSQNGWKLITLDQTTGKTPSARAAHQSALYEDRGWLFIFGGRGPPVDQSSPVRRSSVGLSSRESYEAGRLNDLYCLDLQLMNWTRVITPLDVPDVGGHLWPCGRSWMGMSLRQVSDMAGKAWPCVLQDNSHSSSVDPQTRQTTIQLFITGGFSNSDEPLADAYLIEVSQCTHHKDLEARVIACTTTATETVGEPGDFMRTFVPLTTPELIDGFRCPAEPQVTERAVIKLQRQQGMNSPPSVSDTGSVAPDRDIDPAQIHADINHLAAHYTQLTFSPNNPSANDGEDVQLMDPTKPFYHIARIHSGFVLFLLSHFSLYTVVAPTLDPDPDNRDYLNSTDLSQLVADLDRLCSQLLSTMRPTAHILSVLARLFIRFMLPWEMLAMILQESDAWLSDSARTLLLDQLSSELAGSASPNLELILSAQHVLDKIAILLPIDTIRFPPPFHEHIVNANNRLSYHVQHTIISVLLWSGKGPLSATTEMFHVFPIRARPNRCYVVQASPSPRFWHTVTYSALDHCFYVIGGATAASREHPVECYRLFEPMSLTALCCNYLSGWIFEHSLNQFSVTLKQMTKTRRKFDLVGRPCTEHYQLLKEAKCGCSFCIRLHHVMNASAERELSKWLM
ncbi:hypothetical protein CRM22_010825 [Opisthorchis felineus]|uniref:Uncharacterized protein n=1 Tax=Opisthorchis felineus TaxID=147828 RepID=A0A4S2KLB4_OPIFE|nr:hypothetical protein CRM22_010825 [Opisthorchis felineus]